ncbi:MAG: winged helix-turn-helix domain-containing protein [Myxococcota bacterium]
MAFTVVVVEPDVANRQSLAQALRDAGHTVVDVGTVDEVSSTLRPDVVVVHPHVPAGEFEAVGGRVGPQAHVVVGLDEALREILDLERVQAPELELSGVRIDLRARTVSHPGRVERLTDKEAALLAYLAARSNRPVRREELLVHVWGYRPDTQTRTVDNTVGRLRTKIEGNPGEPVHVHTIRGVGYRLVGVAESPAPAADLTPDRILGRTAELQQIDDRLAAGVRLLTLLGGGGHGKTTLAVAWLDRRGGTFVDLSAARTADDIEQLTRQALGTSFPVAQALAGRRNAVVVLDNVEQLHDVADVLEPWLRAAPEAVLITTSRRRLDLPDERVLEVGPLPDAEALELFLRAGRARRASFATTEADRTHATAVVALLERIPLAIELAAARALTMSPRDLLDRLGRSFRTLRDASRVERHRTLSATLQWSWDQLPQGAQDALARLSIFRGSFDHDAVEAILGEEDALWLDRLVDHSLVRHVRPVAGHARFAMYESVREFAVRQHEERGFKDETQTRHFEYFAARGPQLDAAARGPDAWNALAILREDRREYLTAAQSVGGAQGAALTRALRTLMEVGRMTSDERTFIEGVLPQCTGALEGDLHTMLSVELSQTGDHRKASLDHGRRAWEIAKSLGDSDRICSARLMMAVALRRNNAVDAAREAFEDALDHAPPSPSALRGMALLYSGVHERVHGDIQVARKRCEAALDESSRVGVEWLEVGCLSMLGSVAHVQRRYSDALHANERALELHRREADRQSEMIVLANIGTTRLSMGEPRAALGILEEAKAIALELGSLHYEGRTTTLIARAALAFGEPETALAATRTAIPVLRRGGYLVDVALAHCNASAALRDLSRYDDALVEAAEALVHAEEVKMPRALHRSCTEHARSLWLLNQPQEARPWYARALEHGQSSDLWAEYALLAWHLHRSEDAHTFAQRGVDRSTAPAQDTFAQCVHAVVNGRPPNLEALRSCSEQRLAACAEAFEGQDLAWPSLARLIRVAVDRSR